MPIYRFQIESSLPAENILWKIRALVRESPRFVQSINEAFGDRPKDCPPFIGKVEGNVFRIRRDIHYRNSFLPLVRGSVTPSSNGTKVSISMHLHPFVALFMLFWLGGVGSGMIAAVTSQSGNIGAALFPGGMFAFGIVLTAGGFYPEAFKARRLLEQSIGNAGA